MDERVLLNGENTVITVTGTGSKEKIVVNAGVVPVKHYECTIDFTKDTPKIISERYE